MGTNTAAPERANAAGAKGYQNTDAFRAAMAEYGLLTPDPIIADGALHRIRADGDKRGARNAWYILHPDPFAAGAFGCWKRGISGSWRANEQTRWGAADRKAAQRRIEQARAASLREQAAKHEQARLRAERIWSAAHPARSSHPYLRAKNVTPGSARQSGRRLVLPVTDLQGTLWSLQFIDPTARKMLLSGGRKRGNLIHVSGTVPGGSRVLVCEGWATGRTLAEMDPEAVVLAAIDAGNLEAVAVAVRERWRTTEIVICCDRDPVGIQKGRAAALASNASIAIPAFPDDVLGSDFNDLANALRRVAP